MLFHEVMTFRAAAPSVLLTLSGVVVSLAGITACNTKPPSEAASPTVTTPAVAAQAAAPVPERPTPLAPTAANAAPAAAGAATAPLKLGKPIAGTTTVALADVAKAPGTFKGKTLVTTGTVKAVCQERGCWMELVDEGGHANVRMHGHAFFVPKTSSGKKARVEGTVVLVKDGKECDEMDSTGAKLELDATGVELM